MPGRPNKIGKNLPCVHCGKEYYVDTAIAAQKWYRGVCVRCRKRFTQAAASRRQAMADAVTT